MNLILEITVNFLAIISTVIIGYCLVIAVFENVFIFIFNLPIIITGKPDNMLLWGWIVTPLGLKMGLALGLGAFKFILFQLFEFLMLPLNSYKLIVSIILGIVANLIFSFYHYLKPFIHAKYLMCEKCGTGGVIKDFWDNKPFKKL